MSYQPPSPQYIPPQQQREPGVRFEAINEALQLWRAQLGTWIAAVLANGLLSFAVMIPLILVMLPDLIRGDGRSHLNPSLSFALNLLAAILGGLVSAGLEWIALKQARGRQFSVPDILEPFRRAKLLVPVLLLIALPSALIGLLGPAYSVLMIPVAILLALLHPFISLSYLIAMDQRLNAVDAIKLSIKSVAKNLGAFLALMFVGGLLSALGVLGCGIGMIVTMPIASLCLALAYRDLFPEQAENE